MKTNVKVFVQILNMWHIVSYKLAKVNKTYCICLRQVSAVIVHRTKIDKVISLTQIKNKFSFLEIKGKYN